MWGRMQLQIIWNTIKISVLLSGVPISGRWINWYLFPGTSTLGTIQSGAYPFIRESIPFLFFNCRSMRQRSQVHTKELPPAGLAWRKRWMQPEEHTLVAAFSINVIHCCKGFNFALFISRWILRIGNCRSSSAIRHRFSHSFIGAWQSGSLWINLLVFLCTNSSLREFVLKCSIIGRYLIRFCRWKRKRRR